MEVLASFDFSNQTCEEVMTVPRFHGNIPFPPSFILEHETLRYTDDASVDQAIIDQRGYTGQVWVLARPAHPHRTKPILRYLERELRKAEYAEPFIARFRIAVAEDIPNAMCNAPSESMVGITVYSFGEVGHRVCLVMVSNFLHPDGRARFPKPDELRDPSPDSVHGHGTCWESEMANAFARRITPNFETTSFLHFREDDKEKNASATPR